MKIKILSVLLASIMLTACNSNDNDNNAILNDTSKEDAVTAEDLVGVWKRSSIKPSPNGAKFEDVHYFVFKADGTYQAYDYKNDTLSQSEEFDIDGEFERKECSVKSDYQLGDYVVNNGQISFNGTTNKLNIVDENSFTTEYVEGNTAYIETFRKTEEVDGETKPIAYQTQEDIVVCSDEHKDPVEEPVEEPANELPALPEKPVIPEDAVEVNATKENLTSTAWYNPKKFFGKDDVRYIIYTEDGKSKIYNYQNDSFAEKFGGAKDCYRLDDNGTFEDKGDGNFGFEYDGDLLAVVKDKSLILKDNDGEVYTTYYDIGKKVADLTPICDAE